VIDRPQGSLRIGAGTLRSSHPRPPRPIHQPETSHLGQSLDSTNSATTPRTTQLLRTRLHRYRTAGDQKDRVVPGRIGCRGYQPETQWTHRLHRPHSTAARCLRCRDPHHHLGRSLPEGRSSGRVCRRRQDWQKKGPAETRCSDPLRQHLRRHPRLRQPAHLRAKGRGGHRLDNSTGVGPDRCSPRPNPECPQRDPLTLATGPLEP